MCFLLITNHPHLPPPPPPPKKKKKAQLLGCWSLPVVLPYPGKECAGLPKDEGWNHLAQKKLKTKVESPGSTRLGALTLPREHKARGSYISQGPNVKTSDPLSQLAMYAPFQIILDKDLNLWNSEYAGNLQVMPQFSTKGERSHLEFQPVRDTSMGVMTRYCSFYSAPWSSHLRRVEGEDEREFSRPWGWVSCSNFQLATYILSYIDKSWIILLKERY